MDDRDIAHVIFTLALLFFLIIAIFSPGRTEIRYIEVFVTQTEAPTATPTATPSPTPTVIPTVTPSPTVMPTPAETPTVTPTVATTYDFDSGSVKHLESADGLQLVRVTCYLAAPGAHTADGSVPLEGMCAGAPWRIGQDCVLYDVNTLEPYARLECRDTGGHYLLQTDQAVDVYRDSMDRAWQWVGEHGDYSYIKWIPRGSEDE